MYHSTNVLINLQTKLLCYVYFLTILMWHWGPLFLMGETEESVPLTWQKHLSPAPLETDACRMLARSALKTVKRRTDIIIYHRRRTSVQGLRSLCTKPYVSYQKQGTIVSQELQLTSVVYGCFLILPHCNDTGKKATWQTATQHLDTSSLFFLANLVKNN